MVRVNMQAAACGRTLRRSSRLRQPPVIFTRHGTCHGGWE